MTALIITAMSVMAVSALASLAEAAFYSVPYAKAVSMARAGRRGAKALVRIKEDISKFISAIVIVDNIADLVGSAAVGALAAARFSSWKLGVFFGAFTLVAIVFAKIIPKNIGESRAAEVAPLLAPAALAAVAVMRPVLRLIGWLVAPFRAKDGGRGASEEEIKVMAALGRRSGTIESDESRIIQRVFKLNDITADDMMTLAVAVESIPADLPLGAGKARVLDLRHSRVPVTGESSEQVLGVVLTRDLLAAIARDEFFATPSDFLQDALRVRNDMPADDLLPLFQQREQHLAVVEDADGRMVGVVTLEDVLEELVGEITDEKDIRPETIKRLSKHEILADEGTEISKVNHFFNVQIGHDGTLGDWALEKIAHAPKEGDTFEDVGLTVTVAAMSRTRPKLLRVRKTVSA